MNKFTARVVSVHSGKSGGLGKEPRPFIEAELDGFAGDRHKSFTRRSWRGDKQRKGTLRRNERQWSAVSLEELAEIERELDLEEPLTAASLGANLCLSGVPGFSRLAKGTIMAFPSGAELLVEEYNAPCLAMARELSSIHRLRSGRPLRDAAFVRVARHRRGLVGVVEVAGIISAGDEVTIIPYAPPEWTRGKE